MEDLNRNEVTNYVRAKGRIIGLSIDDLGNKRIVLFIRGYQQRRPIYAPFVIDKNTEINFEVNDYVDVEGRVNAFIYDNEVWTKTSLYTQLMMADKIIKDKPELEKIFGLKGGFGYEDPFIRVFLKGKVIKKSIDEKNGWTNFTINVKNDKNKDSQVRLQFSNRMRVNDVKFEEGDSVATVSNLSSKRKQINGETIDFEDLIVDDMILTDIGEKHKQKENENEPQGLDVDGLE